jgi:hypothetical protein
MFEAEYYKNPHGNKPVEEFILKQTPEWKSWIFAALELLQERDGKLKNYLAETKHIEGKIFELKFKQIPVRILFAYHPRIRKRIVLLHGVIKKRDDLKRKDIETAEINYRQI